MCVCGWVRVGVCEGGVCVHVCGCGWVGVGVYASMCKHGSICECECASIFNQGPTKRREDANPPHHEVAHM